MRRVYASSYIADCDQLRVTLSAAGVESMMKNEFGNPIGLAFIGGVAAFSEPEVWVSDTDYDEAMKIVAGVITTAKGNGTPRSDSTVGSLCEWQCPKCGEVIEGTMNACWKCETERPAQQTGNAQ